MLSKKCPLGCGETLPSNISKILVHINSSFRPYSNNFYISCSTNSQPRTLPSNRFGAQNTELAGPTYITQLIEPACGPKMLRVRLFFRIVRIHTHIHENGAPHARYCRFSLLTPRTRVRMRHTYMLCTSRLCSSPARGAEY